MLDAIRRALCVIKNVLIKLGEVKFLIFED